MRYERKLFDDEAGALDRQPARDTPDASMRPKVRPVGVPHNGSQTSREAAERIAPVASAQAAQVFAFIARQGDGGVTDHEVQTALGVTGDSDRPRRWNRQRAGLIRDSGQRRKSPAGRAAIVWVATDTAMSAVATPPKPSQAS